MVRGPPVQRGKHFGVSLFEVNHNTFRGDVYLEHVVQLPTKLQMLFTQSKALLTIVTKKISSYHFLFIILISSRDFLGTYLSLF